MNRLSLGVQSLRDPALRSLGREHSSSQARAAVQEASRVFGERFTFDLIYGRPGPFSLSDWVAELKVRSKSRACYIDGCRP